MTAARFYRENEFSLGAEGIAPSKEGKARNGGKDKPFGTRRRPPEASQYKPPSSL